ncbi:MAG TPA: EamA family transporter [Gemmatimonadaceae bacterium]|nr:EamA family transporter [Gemmatimonadaceae bacterium]
MTTADRVSANAPRNVMIAAAFAAIYLIWGSTYLAIKYAIETVPPFLMTGARFLIAGGVLYAWSVFRPAPTPAATTASIPSAARAWRDAFIVGALLIVGGTALVGWAELSVPSGVTSLILATTPVWMVMLESVSARRAPEPRVIAGVTVGLAGLAILIWPSLMAPGSGAHLLGVAALALAALTWSAGGLYSRRAALPASAARATGMQMLAGAVLSLLVGVSLGEHHELSLAAITPASLVAIGYLVVAGALVGFSAYLWLMRVSTPSRVATHAYVNPVVAVLLGWAVLGETFTARTAVAMGVIVVAVVLIVSAPAAKRVSTPAGVTPPRRAGEPNRLARQAA